MDLEGCPSGDPLHLHTVPDNRLPEAEWRWRVAIGCLGLSRDPIAMKRWDARGSGDAGPDPYPAASLVPGYCRRMSRLHSVLGNTPLEQNIFHRTLKLLVHMIPHTRNDAGEEKCLASHHTVANALSKNEPS